MLTTPIISLDETPGPAPDVFRSDAVPSVPLLPALALVPLADRVASWGPSELSRWSRVMAVHCANSGAPASDIHFNIEPHGDSFEEQYRRASDPSFWRRRGARALRIAQEAAELRAGLVGKGTAHLYASSSALDWSKHAAEATRLFVNGSVVHNHTTNTSLELSKVVTSDAAKAAKYYTFLKGLEVLAGDAGLRWAMLTITLPSEFHANPANGSKHKWNGVTADIAHREIARGWQRVRSSLLKHGITLSGVRTEEPQKDGTPHWHCAFFYKDAESLRQICRAVLRQFPAGLRIREALPSRSKKLRFRAVQYKSLVDYDAGTFHKNTRLGAQCQIDVGTPKTAKDGSDGIRSFASYVLKYVAKSFGIDKGTDQDDDASIIETGPAMAVKAHRQTYGIRAIEFYGIAKGAASAWDLLRQVELVDKEGNKLPVPLSVAALAVVCQRDKGAGVVEYLEMLGGLAAAPLPTLYTVKPAKVETKTRYGSRGVKLVGVEVTPVGGVAETHILRVGEREIMSTAAAAAVATAYDKSELGVSGVVLDAPAAAAAGLVQIGTVITASNSQLEAIQADVHASHTVLAAAGSGKTSVLIARAAYLVKRGVNASDIAITTFTREAAENVRARLPHRLSKVQVGTMHSLAGRWLAVAGVKASSFDDVIAASTALGQHDKYVLLDEAQDCSAEQWAWANAHSKTLFSVGDTRQAIYGWRNAKAGDLVDEASKNNTQPDFFKAGGLIDMPYNLRSASALVALGNAIATVNAPAAAVSLGGEVTRTKVTNLSEEVTALIAWCAATTGSRAVLARTNTEVSRIKSELVLSGHADVPVMTVHASKGLEFDHVALACGRRKPSEDGPESTETFYVAVTRAKQSLYITSVGQLPAILSAAIERLTSVAP